MRSFKQSIIIIIICLAVVAGAGLIYADWENPTTNPTEGNVLAPINIGDGLQDKAGPFVMQGIFETYNNTFLSTLGGSVGIGTTTPGYKLDVNGSIKASGIYLVNDQQIISSDAFNINVGDLTSTDDLRGLVLWAGGQDRVFIDTNGNVGVGTMDPKSKLVMHDGDNFNGELRLNYQLDAVGTMNVDAWANNTGSGYQRWGRIRFGLDGGSYSGQDSSIRFETASGGAVSEKVRIDKNGNVGIGTTNPNYTLDVNGTINIPVNTPYRAAGNAIVGTGNSAYTYLREYNNQGIQFQNNAGNAMAVITTGGSVGINTATPSEKLEVVGKIKGTELCIGMDCRSAWPSATAETDPTVNALAKATLSCSNGQIAKWNGSSWICASDDGGAGGTITGAGTAGKLAKWINGTSLGDSLITEGASSAFLSGAFETTGATLLATNSGNVGIGTVSPGAKLGVSSDYPQLILNNPTPGRGIQLMFRDNGVTKGVIGNLDDVSKLQFSGGSGTAHMTINNVGDVGIGTPNPSTKLDVIVSNGAMTGIDVDNIRQIGKFTEIADVGGRQGDLRIGGVSVPANNSVAIYSASSQNSGLLFATREPTTGTGKARMVITGAGNVGIGTAGPQRLLHLNGDNGYVRYQNGARTWEMGGNTSGNFEVKDVSANSFPIMILGNSGNVGIGTTNPGAILDVRYRDASTNIYRASDSAGRYRWWVDQNFDMLMNNGSTDTMVIKNSGNVGIGTTNPGTNRLYVNGNITSSGNISANNIYGNVGYANNAGNATYASGATNANNIQYVPGNSVYADIGYIYNNFGVGGSLNAGNITVSGGATLKGGIQTDLGNGPVSVSNGLLYSGSSNRFKNNIQTLSISGKDLENIVKLRPVKFNWNFDNSEDIGLIAEEVIELVPNLAILDKDGKPDAVRYDKLPLYLLELIKSQQSKITDLESRLSALEEKIK